MKLFLLKFAKYSLVLFILLNLISFVVLETLSNSEFYKPQFVKNYDTKKEFDYVVLGSSLGLTTLDTKQIDTYFNSFGLNISMDDSFLNSHYLMLQHFYASNKKTKRLVLCLNYEDVSSSTYQLNNNDYRFITEIQHQNISDYYYENDTDHFKKLYLSKYFPIIGVSYYNYELFFPSILSLLHPKKHNKFDDKGNFLYPDTHPEKLNMVSIPKSITIKNKYFKKIYDFCEAKGIEMIVYQPPVYGKKISYENLPKDVQFINHSDLITNDLFYDMLHVNRKGRTFCTLAFCKEFNIP
jgi:hypothetical protein